MAKYLVRTPMTQDGLDLRYVLNKATTDAIGNPYGMTNTVGAARVWNTARAAQLFARRFSRETGITVVHDIAPV